MRTCDITVLEVSPDRSSVKISWGNVTLGFQKIIIAKKTKVVESSRSLLSQTYDSGALEIPRHVFKKILRQAKAILARKKGVLRKLRKKEWQPSSDTFCPICYTSIPDGGECPNCN